MCVGGAPCPAPALAPPAPQTAKQVSRKANWKYTGAGSVSPTLSDPLLWPNAACAAAAASKQAMRRPACAAPFWPPCAALLESLCPSQLTLQRMLSAEGGKARGLVSITPRLPITWPSLEIWSSAGGGSSAALLAGGKAGRNRRRLCQGRGAGEPAAAATVAAAQQRQQQRHSSELPAPCLSPCPVRQKNAWACCLRRAHQRGAHV